MKSAFIWDHAQRWPVLHLCHLLGVQRSAYDDWRDWPDQVLLAKELALRQRMKALFKASRGSLGGPPWRANCVRKASR